MPESAMHGVLRRSRLLSAVAAAGAAAALAAGCGGSSTTSSGTAATGGSASTAAAPTVVPASGSLPSVTWNLSWGEPNTLDPLSTTGFASISVLSNLCDTLYSRDPVSGKMQPRLATSMSRPDPKTFVYELRDDVKFWDGNPLTAEDVAFSLNRNLDPTKAFAQYAYFANVKSITATGPHQVTVKFKRPDTLFQEALPLPFASAVSEAAYVKREGEDYGRPTGGVMCSGPYKLERWTPGSQLELTANTGYWDKALVPKVEKLTFKFVVDTSAVTAGLLSGEIDGTTDVPASAIGPLKGSSSGQFNASTGPQEFQILPSGGLLADANVRKALNLAIDRPAIAQSIFAGLAKPAIGLYPQWTWSSYPESARDQFAAAEAKLPGATPDVEGAKAAFAAAGSPKGTIVLGLLSGDKVQASIATIIQSAAEKAGLDVELKQMPTSQYNGIYTGPDARKGVDGVLVTGASATPDPQDWVPFYAFPGQSLNFLGYDNPKVTAQVDEARSTLNPDKRAQLLISAQDQFIGQDQIVIPVINFDYLTYVNKRVGGFVPTYFNAYFGPWAARLGAAG